MCICDEKCSNFIKNIVLYLKYVIIIVIFKGGIMNKYKLIQMKKKLMALGLAGVMLGTAGCTSNKNENGGEPSRVSVSQDHSNVENYYKYAMQNGKAVKLYNSQNVYLLYNKETYEVNEYIFQNQVTWLGGAELYDLETEEMLFYSDGINTTYNREFYEYLIENNYQVCLNEVSDYVEDHVAKEYYSLDEIRELEPQIEESLKIINKAKVKIK